MPDILIRGVQFPTMAQAYKTLIVSYDGKVYEGVCPQPTAKKKESIAHAVELPEHGELIDKQATFKALSEKFKSSDGFVSWTDAIDIVLRAPVVIPADKEETE